MILTDVNVLVYAFRDDTPQHSLCRSWLQEVAVGEAHFGLSPLALASVIRVTTNPRIFREASSVEEAFAYCKQLRSLPHAQMVTPGERHWDIFERLCRDTGTRGPRVSDVWFAALAIEWDCEWITFDRDFARFPGLKCRQPTVV